MSATPYDRLGVGYSRRRRADPKIAEQIVRALGSAQSVLNVGAGAGSYEPDGRFVIALEPSLTMLAQRARQAAPAVRGSADRLPFPDASFDAAMAILTMHHWPSWTQGLREMRRVARERLVILTWDPDHDGFWLVQDYFPEILRANRRVFPPLDAVANEVGRARIEVAPIPADCLDGFLGAYWRRPAAYLDPSVRQGISVFADLENLERGLKQLELDIASGAWLNSHGDLLALEQLDAGYRLVVAESRRV